MGRSTYYDCVSEQFFFYMTLQVNYVWVVEPQKLKQHDLQHSYEYNKTKDIIKIVHIARHSLVTI